MSFIPQQNGPTILLWLHFICLLTLIYTKKIPFFVGWIFNVLLTFSGCCLVAVHNASVLGTKMYAKNKVLCFVSLLSEMDLYEMPNTINFSILSEHFQFLYFHKIPDVFLGCIQSMWMHLYSMMNRWKQNPHLKIGMFAEEKGTRRSKQCLHKTWY